MRTRPARVSGKTKAGAGRVTGPRSPATTISSGLASSHLVKERRYRRYRGIFLSVNFVVGLMVDAGQLNLGSVQRYLVNPELLTGSRH